MGNFYIHLATNCLSRFDHFVGLVFQGLKKQTRVIATLGKLVLIKNLCISFDGGAFFQL